MSKLRSQIYFYLFTDKLIDDILLNLTGRSYGALDSFIHLIFNQAIPTGFLDGRIFKVIGK